MALSDILFLPRPQMETSYSHGFHEGVRKLGTYRCENLACRT